MRVKIELNESVYRDADLRRMTSEVLKRHFDNDKTTVHATFLNRRGHSEFATGIAWRFSRSFSVSVPAKVMNTEYLAFVIWHELMHALRGFKHEGLLRGSHSAYYEGVFKWAADFPLIRKDEKPYHSVRRPTCQYGKLPF